MTANDRRVQRTFFAELVELNQNLNIALASMEVGAAQRTLTKILKPDEPTEKLDAEIEVVVRQVLYCRVRAAEYLKILMECPDSTDIIH